LVLYREFSGICGITHTHSTYAVAWAQAKKPVPIFGTTHADHCTEEIPCTDFMKAEAVKNDYELETGNLIVETFRKNNFNQFLLTRCQRWYWWQGMAHLPGETVRLSRFTMPQFSKKYVKWLF
jgi:L-ribulose-5-phosphate 4-epimerase